MSLHRPGICVLLLAACGVAQQDPAEEAPNAYRPVPSADATAAAPADTVAAQEPAVLRVNGVLNGGFEWIADATTEPPKYGAYWLGAFVPVAGDATCLVVEDGPFRGARCLRLSTVTGEVLQKVVTDPRWTERVTVALAVRTRRGGALEVTLEDGPGRRTSVRLAGGEGGLLVTDVAGAPVTPLLVAGTALGAAASGEDTWWRVELDLGARFVAEHGSAPVPRLNLRLRCTGDPGALADVDEVSVGTDWPAVEQATLARDIEVLVRGSLELWFLPQEQGGQGMVDGKTGYVVVQTVNVETGGNRQAATTASFHTVHTLLMEWLREARRRGDAAEVARWTPELERITRTLLTHNFHPQTGLPRTVSLATLAPNDGAAATVGAYVDFLLDARELIADEELRGRCLAQSRKIADTLIALQQRHDIPPAKAPPLPVWSVKANRFEGDTSNWFGHIPDRLNARGEIETDKRFYTSWAILSGRNFWYELMRSPRAIARVAELAPKPGDLEALHRAIGKFHRDWDAARYDLENDTDDHYGYLCDDLLATLKHSGGNLGDALALVQGATDHRLPREVGGAPARADDTVWIQAVRLGTACAGDSPRAFLGVLELYELPPSLNPISSGLPLYRDALLELAQNDLKGRQLTNGQFTESFFKNWEMVCICYRGTYQGDCREHPKDYWHGDVGDTFGGPPTSGIDAQMAAFRVASPALRPQILSGLGIVQHVTDRDLRRPLGYLFGLDPAIARQYELQDDYVIGLTAQSAAGLGWAMAWVRLLPWLATEGSAGGRLPPAPRLSWVESPLLGRTLRIEAPAGMVVALPHAERPFPAPVSDRDGRMLALDLADGAADAEAGFLAALRVTIGPNGEHHVPLSRLPFTTGTVQPLLLDPVSGEPLVIGEAFAL